MSDEEIDYTAENISVNQEEVLENEEDEEEDEDENVEEQTEIVSGIIKKFRRCQRRKRAHYSNLDQSVDIAEDEENVQEEKEDTEDEGEEEEEEWEEQESLSEYSSILSAVSFEWENEHYEFLDLCDPGTMDNIYHPVFAEIQYDAFGKTRYLHHCDQLRIPPIVRFYNSLHTKKVDLTFHGINSKQMLAICGALELNEHVEVFILKGNLLSSGCCRNLSHLLRKNPFITLLDLSGCRIGPEGALLLSQCLKGNEGLKELNLSKCNIGDEGMSSLSIPLKGNYILEKLILSHNELGADAAESMATIFYSNNSITMIDLDNNNLNEAVSMRKFFRSLSMNTALTYLTLKWNAINSIEIADSISTFLKRNISVKCIDLSENRFNSQSVRPFRKGLAGARGIDVLRLGRNPIVSEDAEYLLGGLKTCYSLKILDLSDIWVRKEFVKALKKIQTTKSVQVLIGGVYSDYTISGPDYAALILKRARFEAMKPKKRALQRDFGHLMFMLGDEPLNTADFMDIVSKFKAKVNDELYPELIKQFLVPKVNTIDVVAMRKKYLSIFPDSKPPEQKKTKKENQEEEEKEQVFADEKTTVVVADGKQEEAGKGKEDTEGPEIIS